MQPKQPGVRLKNQFCCSALARKTVQVSRLVKEAQGEISCIAVKP